MGLWAGGRALYLDPDSSRNFLSSKWYVKHILRSVVFSFRGRKYNIQGDIDAFSDH